MKILGYILALLFVLFAYFQFNDPDPWTWVVLYLIVAFIAFRSAGGHYSMALIWATIGACIMGFFYTFPGVWDYMTNQEGYTIMQGMSNDQPYIEETREFGGLLIALIAVLVIYFQGRKNQ